MKKILTVLVFFASLQAAVSQKSPVKFGDIPLEDLKMTTYDKDSSAVALVLVDYGEAYVDVSPTDEVLLIFKTHVRIKILKAGGLQRADVSISLFHSGSKEEKVVGLKGSTYNLENGKVVETSLSKDNIFKEKFNQNYNHQKFTLPGVKVGSVIEYVYTVNSPYYTSFPNYQFQRRIPIRWSEYWASIPVAFRYEKYMQGYIAPTSYDVKQSSAGNMTVNAHHWILKDVPAFKDEPFMTCEEDYISKVNFELASVDVPGQISQQYMGSWEKLSELLLKQDNFGKVISKSGFLKEKAEALVAGITDPLLKIEAIHSYVKQTIEWDGTKDFTAGNLKKIIEIKKGTSGDINLILASLLDKAGFEVEMILLSTRDHGFIRKQFPLSSQFNYVICSVTVGDKVLLLDATEKYLPMSVLPEQCLNGQGLIISEKKNGWIELVPKAKSKTVVTTEFQLSNKGELNGKITYSRDGYDAFEMRSSYHSKGEDAYVKGFLKDRPWTVEKTTFAEVDNLSKPVKQVHDVLIEEHASVTGDIIYVNPFVALRDEKNPFTQETREYPVDFGSAVESTYSSRITLPEGFTVDELPKSKVMMLPGNTARFSYNATLVGNSVSITSSVQINKSLFLQAEYPALREFYAQVIAKQEEQIVLKKKP